MTSWPGWAPSPGSHRGPRAPTPRGSGANVVSTVAQVTKSGNMLIMPRSPIGAAVADDIRRQKKADPEYRKVRARFARAEAVARLLIPFRMKPHLTHEPLPPPIGTSAPPLSPPQ